MASPPRSRSVGTPPDPYRYLAQLPEPDGDEVEEWADSVDALVEVGGAGRAQRVLLHVLGRARSLGLDVPGPGITDYLKNGGTLETAAAIAGHASTKTTQLYNRNDEALSVTEIERIQI